MLEWMKKRGSPARDEAKADADADVPKRHGYNKAGKYRWLYEYLEKRYANTVVLTFGQVEDLWVSRCPIWRAPTRSGGRLRTSAPLKPVGQTHGGWPAERPRRI
jgi:hypothetical protein